MPARRLVTGVISGALVMTLVAFTPPSAAEFTFDCGSSEPPSGRYLHPILNKWYDYDCTTHVLTPLGDAAASCLTAVVAGVLVAQGGACMILWNLGEQEKDYDYAVLVSVVGSYDLETYAHDHSNGLKEVCEPAGPCGGVLVDEVVTFHSATGNFAYSSCSPHVSGGHIELISTTGSRAFAHTNLLSWCA